MLKADVLLIRKHDPVVPSDSQFDDDELFVARYGCVLSAC
jgi:hypothetical protein